MTSDLLIILVFGGCLGGWVMLALLGAERQRMIRDSETARAKAHAEAAPHTAPGKGMAGRPAAKPRAPAKPTPAPNAR